MSENQHEDLIKEAQPGEPSCSECGSKLCHPNECFYCDGNDNTGEMFCPKCDFCCGC